MVKKKYYAQFQQAVYQQTLENGLDVVLIPQQGFKKTYAILTTNYGAVDNRFVPIQQDQLVTVPAGIAHFLEHKMFEKADHDAFDLFGQFGADANAFTSYTQTSYQFSTAQQFAKNLSILLDFVQDPYFSRAGVKKEQGIIGQEIRMYNDNSDSRLYTGTIANLYPADPMKNDIAGTEESIKKITPELLMQCYQTFYQPSNLRLVVVGNLDVEQTLGVIEQCEKDRQQVARKIQRGPLIQDVQGNDIIANGSIRMPIGRPKAMVGIRGLSQYPDARKRLKYKLACELMLELLFDDTTTNYLDLYNQQIIDDSFGFSFEMERGFHFATISSDTDDPARFFNAIQKIARHAKENLAKMDAEFEKTKRGAMGRLIMSLNLPEMIANRYASSLFGELNIFDELEILRLLTLGDVYDACQQLLGPHRFTNFTVQPEKM
ncbi:EF-P 5-aminopentanol modification-associated protein YfmH [Limosilactobacillus caecicola]|uniref:EF-P 5-aminopentanol modification-associated protein YfmH n=1 Tax=Limosilactobacillus caecicola TaxID=2941332 RepID=UPI0020406870|nr:pitrilysin family protein [Limosilactobacillus caecicola]